MKSSGTPKYDGPDRIAISVVILAKNEKAGIADAVKRVERFAQVIVVDSHSTDGTAEIASSLGAEVVQFSWDGRYPKKKQWSLDHAGARYPWVLLLDADEYPSDELISELAALQSELSSNHYSAYNLLLSYRFAGSFLRHGHRVTKRSLLRPAASKFPVVDDLNAPGIREVEGHYQPISEGRVGQLRGRLMHDDQDPISSWFDRHNRYSEWEAHLRMNSEVRRDVASKRSNKGAIFDRVPFKPLVFFAYSYILRLGFLDGRPGLDYAIALSSYYWQIGVKFRELNRVERLGQL